MVFKFFDKKYTSLADSGIKNKTTQNQQLEITQTNY